MSFELSLISFVFSFSLIFIAICGMIFLMRKNHIELNPVTKKQVKENQDKFNDSLYVAIEFLKINGMSWQGIEQTLTYDVLDKIDTMRTIYGDDLKN